MGDSETPLLRSGIYVEGCPGCILDRRKIEHKGAPTKELCFVALLALCNALPISSLFPFIYFMVRDFNIVESATDIATYAGYIGSAFMLGRFVASAPWGLVADKYGRKPVIIFGTASIIIFNTLFGFSTTFWMALLSRFLLGLFNGLLGTIRAYISEICSKEYQAFGMSLVGTMWGVGLIIGPAIGGYLAQPSTQYPSLFPSGSIFDLFPYALPCLCISFFAALSLVVSFWIPESLHKHSSAYKASDVESSCNKEKQDHDQYGSTDGLSKKTEDLKTFSEKESLLHNWGLVSSISLCCIWSLHDMAYTEIFSLWAVSPGTYGGLDFTTSDVGVVLAVCGAALLLFQLLLYPRVQKMLGPIQTARVSAVLTIPLLAIYPLIARLSGIILWAVLICASIAKNVFSISVMTASFILINNSVKSEQRGVANGVSMSFMSLFKAVGPACAGLLLSWAEKRIDASFLPGTWMVFVILDVFAFITIIVTFEPILPRSLDNPKYEPDDVLRDDGHLERQASFTL